MAEIENMNEEQVLSPEETLKELRKNTVSKSSFDELQKRYNKLYADIANGHYDADDEEPKGPSEEEKEEYFQSQILAKHYGKVRGSYANMKLLLDVDDYLTSHGKRSCFAPSKGDLSDADENMCSAMHDILKRAVDESDGDDSVASALFANSISVQ